MILKVVTGCMAWSVSADDDEVSEMTDERRQDVLNYIFKALKPEDLDTVMNCLVKEFGEYECDDEPCEQCGDYVETYTWEI